MLSLHVLDENVKTFMNKLLRDDTFDGFETRSVVIATFARFEINEEKITKDGENSARNICLWSEIKPFVLSILKGRQKPSYIKAVFSFDTKKIETVTQNASALFLNVVFDGVKVTVTTGIAQKDFSLDKSPANLWDGYVTQFLTDANIPFISQI